MPLLRLINPRRKPLVLVSLAFSSSSNPPFPPPPPPTNDPDAARLRSPPLANPGAGPNPSPSLSRDTRREGLQSAPTPPPTRGNTMNPPGGALDNPRGMMHPLRTPSWQDQLQSSVRDLLKGKDFVPWTVNNFQYRQETIDKVQDAIRNIRKSQRAQEACPPFLARFLRQGEEDKDSDDALMRSYEELANMLEKMRPANVRNNVKGWSSLPGGGGGGIPPGGHHGLMSKAASRGRGKGI